MNDRCVTVGLCAAFVPVELGRRWAEGSISDLQLWKHPDTGRGTCLFVAELEGKLSWRMLARLVRIIPPSQLCFRSKIDSMLSRCKRYGARDTFWDNKNVARYYADGPELKAFLKSLGVSDQGDCDADASQVTGPGTVTGAGSPSMA